MRDANRGSVYVISKQAHFQHGGQAKNNRQLALERLDALHAALWPKAMQGHPGGG